MMQDDAGCWMLESGGGDGDGSDIEESDFTRMQ